MVNNFREAIVAFVAMAERRQIAQPKELNTTNINRNGASPHRNIGLSLTVYFCNCESNTISPLPSVLTVFQSVRPHKY